MKLSILQLNNVKISALLFIMLGIFVVSTAQAADPRWEDDFNDCPVQDLVTFSGFSCDSAESICGVDVSGSTDVAQCYDRSLMSYPIASTTSNVLETGGLDGGYIIDCYADMDAATPYCDNTTNWWCNRDDSCDDINTWTVCNEDDSSFNCGDCYGGYQECDGNIADGDGCEVRTDISGCNAIDGGNNINNRVDAGCNCDCDPGYLDCNDDDLAVYGQGASDGDINTGNCEVQTDVSACNILGGLFIDENNSVNGSCGCTCDTNYLDCDDDDSDVNTGTGNCELRINWDDANHVRDLDCSTTQCEADWIDCGGDGTGSDGDCEIHDGEACVTPYGEPGTIMGCSLGSENCVADVVNFQTGTEAKYATNTPLLWGTQYGTGPLMKLMSQSASTTGGVFFIENDGRIGIGTSTDLGLNAMLTVGMSSGTQFIINKSGVVTAGTWEGSIIGVDFGGTGTTTWEANSIVYADSDDNLSEILVGNEGQVMSINAGVPSWQNTAVAAHSILSAGHTDADPQGPPVRGDMMVGSSTGVWNKLTLGTDGYILYSDGTDAVWNSFEGLFAGQLAGTTTDALAEGTMNYYYQTSLFAADLAATTTLANILSLAGVEEIGTIATGTWQADLIDVVYGGTGWDSTGETGLALLTGGVWSASSSIGSANLDSAIIIEGEDVSLLNNDADYITLTSLTSPADGITYNNTNGQFSITAGYEIPITASTTNWNDIYNDVTSDRLTWDAAYGWGNHATFGYFSTTSAQVLDVAYGGTGTSTEFTQGSIVFAGQNGIYTEDNGNFFWDDMNNRLGIGTTTPGRDLTIEGDMDITGTIFPYGSAAVGSAINRFQDGYFVNLDVQNMTVGSTSISGAAGNSFTINSDNATADLEDSSLIFARGIPMPDAQILWDSSEDTFMFNFPIGLEDMAALKFYEDTGSGGNYVELHASTTLGADLSWTLPTTVGASGDSLMLDTAGNMVWANTGEIIDGVIGQIPYYRGASNVLTGTSSIFISLDTSIGIGTTSPLAKLDVYGNLMLSGQNRYVNFASSSGIGGYGMRDFNGQVQVKSRGGAWASIGAGAESLSGLNDTSVVGVNFGELLYMASSGNWEALATSSLNVALSDTRGTLDVNRGGTGLSSTPAYGNLLIGNASNGYTLVSTSSLGLAELDNKGTSGQVPFFDTGGRVLTATSVIYIDTATGFVGIATTTPGRQLTVDGSGQFNELCFDDGTCISNWNSAGSIDATGTINPGQVAVWSDSDTLTSSSTLGANVGGTGKSDWTPLSIPYLQGTTTFGEITMGSSTYVLAVNAVGTGYEWVSASSTGVVLSQEEVDTYVDALINDPDSTHTRISITYNDAQNAMDFVVDNNLNNYDWTNIGTGHLTNTRGGTGWDSSASTGIAVLDAGAWSASTTLGNDYLDSNVMIEGEDISLFNNDSNYIPLTALSSTDTALTYNNTNGQFSITAGYNIPSTASTTNWNGAYDTVTLGNANWDSAYTIVTASSTDWQNTFDTVTTGNANWDTSYNWGNHSTYGYFSTTSAQVLEIQYGGTGTTTWEQNSLVYASANDTLSEILAGSDGQILKSENGVPTWVATSSLGIDFSDVGGMLDADQGGTGTSTDTWTGFAYIDSGVWNASNTISQARLDSLVIVEGEGLDLLDNSITNYITLGSLSSTAGAITYNNGNGQFSITAGYNIPLTASTTNWNGTYDMVTLASADWNWTYDIVNASSTAWQNTYETVTAGLSNWDTAFGWGNHATYGYFSTSSDQILDIQYGGTGTTTWQEGSLVYSDVDNSLSEVLAGTEGQVLVMRNGSPFWSATSSGAVHPLLGAEHSDVVADSVVRGDLIIGSTTPGNAWARLALGPDGYILRSDGTDLTWSTTTNITALGTVLVGRWEADVIDIAYGGTGATTATGARENLDLDEVYKFGVNATGTDGYVWKSDGDGRGEWVATSSLNMVDAKDRTSKFMGTTSVEYDGHFSTTTPDGIFEGYKAANIICEYEYSGSHFCRTYDILASIEQDDTSTWSGRSWVAEGPPGFTSSSNDCTGWTSNDPTSYGAWWDFKPDGGAGWLIYCDYTRPLACCAR